MRNTYSNAYFKHIMKISRHSINIKRVMMQNAALLLVEKDLKSHIANH